MIGELTRSKGQIFKDINSSIRLFADDTSLYIIVDDPFMLRNN